MRTKRTCVTYKYQLRKQITPIPTIIDSIGVQSGSLEVRRNAIKTHMMDAFSELKPLIML